MYLYEGNKKHIKRKTNRPNFHKGSRPRIPSQTIGNTKVQINSDSAIQKLKNLATKYRNINDPRGFLTDLRIALGIPESNGVSKYGVVTIPKDDGTELTISLRITNHQANANTYIEHNANYEYNLSIVIKKKRRKNTFIPNDNVILDEFVYYGNNLQKVESPLSKIAEGLIEYITIGKYEDRTGVALSNASPQPNNQKNIKENMKTNKIKLTESQLHKVIKESVKRVLREETEGYRDMGDEDSYVVEPRTPQEREMNIKFYQMQKLCEQLISAMEDASQDLNNTSFPPHEDPQYNYTLTASILHTRFALLKTFLEHWLTAAPLKQRLEREAQNFRQGNDW